MNEGGLDAAQVSAIIKADIANGIILTYFDRGDVTDWDFDLTDVTADDTWRELDISSIIEGTNKARCVHLRLNMKNTLTKSAELRRGGATDEFNIVRLKQGPVNITLTEDCLVKTDIDGKFEYKLEAGGWVSFGIVVRGWF